MRNYKKHIRLTFIANLLNGVVLSLVSTFSSAQGWQRSYGTTSSTATESSYGVVVATDGDYVMMGYTTSSGSGDMFILKVSSDGSTYRWGRRHGVSTLNDRSSGGGRYTMGMNKTTDGGYYVAGFYPATFFSNPGQEMSLVKISATGTIAWERTYGSTIDISGSGDYPTDMAFNVYTTTDGGPILSGYCEGGITGSNDYNHEVSLVKASNTGTLQWTLMFGTTSATAYPDEVATWVEQTTDGGYIITGSTTNCCGGSDLYIAKVPFAGTSVSWARRIGTNVILDWEEGFVVHQATDGGYVALGNGYSPFLVKTPILGTSNTWVRTYTVTGASALTADDFIKTTDGGYAIAGSVTISGNKDVLLIKTNDLGAPQWSMRFGGSNSEEGYALRQTTDGGYIISGSSTVTGYGSQFYLIKTDANGSSGMNEAAVTSSTLAITYTNTAQTPNHITTFWSSGLTKSTGTFTSSQVIILGPNGAALPVQLLSLAGSYHTKTKNVILNWSTASEQNNDHFIIERNNTDGTGEWENIGIVKGAGNSSYTKHYYFSDTDLPPPDPKRKNLFYRLKQTDYNGQYEYFGPISVSLVPAEEIVVHTNATNEQLLVSFPESAEGKNSTIKIYDMSGRVCFSSPFMPSEYKKDMWIDASNMSSGVYIVSVSTANGLSLQKKFVKQ